MMKILLNTLLILATSASLMAQSFGQRIGKNEQGPKGNILVYGSLDYSKKVTPAGSASEFGTSPNASIPLGVGYFINNNDLVGVNFAFAQQKADNNVNARQSEVGIWYSPSVMLGKYFGLIAQFDAHYVWGEQNDEKYDGYRLRAYPMLGVFLGNGWALKFKFGELSMLSTKRNAGWSHDYVAGLSGATFGTGISKTFKIRK